MNETTLTETPTEAGATEALPSNPEGATSAEVTTEQTQTDPNAGGQVETAGAAPAEPDEDLEWAKKVGVDLDDPNAVKQLAKIARDNQKAARQSLRETASTAVETGNSADDTVRRLEVKDMIRDFKDGLREQGMTKDQIDEIDAQMAEVAIQRPHLVGDLDALYAVSQSSNTKAALKAAEERGRAAAAAQIARSSAATSPRGNASSGNLSKTPEQERLERFSKWD